MIQIRFPEGTHDFPDTATMRDGLLAMAEIVEGPLDAARLVSLLPVGCKIVEVVTTERVIGEDAPSATPAAPTVKRDRRTKVEIAAARFELVAAIRTHNPEHTTIRDLSALVGRDVEAIARDLRNAPNIACDGTGSERVYQVAP